MEEKSDIYDLGLQADLQMLNSKSVDRRRFIKIGLTSGVAALLAACNTPEIMSTATQVATAVPQSNTSNDTTNASSDGTVCVDEIPQETAGPYPADGSQASNQTLNALALSGIVRSDIRTSLGTGNTADGIPATIELTLVDITDPACPPLEGYALYIWHCDRGGNYSMYSQAAVDEDYLRGVQVSDSSGKLSFTSIFPACYAGRWPHAHFEIYSSLDSAVEASNAIHTSQLAVPESVCDAVYATEGYEQSVNNLSQLSLDSDNVFSDGVESQLATVTGDNESGYLIQLTIGVDPANEPGQSSAGGAPAPGQGGGPGGPQGGPGGDPPAGGPPPEDAS